MIQSHRDTKPEYCKECKEKKPHMRKFTGVGSGHYRPISATCMKCGTVIYYE